jgi:hypothetical protein
MAELWQAFETLGPRDFSDIPTDCLSAFLQDTFSAAHTIVNSVPQGGESTSNDSLKQADAAATRVLSSADMPSIHSFAPPPCPAEIEMSKCWGKPLRLYAKDNPLGLSLYKMAAHDRHGAWFARRSIHKGLPFSRWKAAMQREFHESMAIVGAPGAGSIRGIGAEKRLERNAVPEVGSLEVWHLSAQFPGPTAPRDFVTCLLSSDQPSEGANADFMIVSIPVEHAEAPSRNGMVRGQYESVEVVRRVKGWSAKSKSTDMLSTFTDHEKTGRDRGNTIGFAESRGMSAKGERIDQPETPYSESDDLVEWIMITRSDPGGGIPRFMVERGTPSSIAADAVKFLDWAVSNDFNQEYHINDESSSAQISITTTSEDDQTSELYPTPSNRTQSNASTFEPSNPNDTGVIAALTSVVRSGLDRYAPGVQESLSKMVEGGGEIDDESDSSSVDSFASAIGDDDQSQNGQGDVTPSRAAEAPHQHLAVKDAASASPSASSLESVKAQENLASNLEAKLTKLEERRRNLSNEFEAASKRDEARANDALGKEAKEAAKAKDRLERERRKREEKYAREMRKLEDKRRNEERKTEEKRRKAMQGDLLTQTKRERDQARRMAEVLKQENEILRDRVGDLQRENTLIVQRMSRMSGGRELVREIKLMVSAKTDLGKSASKENNINSSQNSLRPRSASPSSGSSKQ